MPVILSIASALCYGLGDFSGGLASRRNPVTTVLVFSQLAGLLGVLAVMPFIGLGLPRVPDLAWGALSGLGGAAGLWLVYSGLARYGASIVSPAAALVGTAIPVLFGVMLGERPGVLSWVGVSAALPAILLLTAEPGAGNSENSETRAVRKAASRAALLMGICAGAGFGVFFIAISRASAGAGLWPFVGARAASITAVLAAGIASGSAFRLHPEHRWAVPAAGLLDMAANVLFLLAARSGLLVLVAVITSLYPAPTVILSRIAFREKLTRHRIAGIALAVTGVALMSV